MTRVSGMTLVLAAGGLAGVCAAEPAVTGDYAATRLAGHIYMNVATGEVVRTTGGSSRIGELYWQNDSACINRFWGQDNPTRDPASAGGAERFGTLAVHWGDVPAALTNGYDVAYATNIGCDTLGTGVQGLNMINVFIDSYDGELDPGGASAAPIAGFVLESMPGGDCTLGTSLFQAWIFTVDLEGSGNEFSWGDASGGLTDLDGDGLHDFGYGYSFEQEQSAPKGIIGPLLVQPASLGGAGTATGCPDLFDWFNPDESYLGAFWFGGGDCVAQRPFASFILNLYGTIGSGGGGECDPIDYNGDGIIDFADYLEFLNRFDAQDPSADLNHDGIVDFGDYLEFLNLFDACSGG